MRISGPLWRSWPALGSQYVNNYKSCTYSIIKYHESIGSSRSCVRTFTATFADSLIYETCSAFKVDHHKLSPKRVNPNKLVSSRWVTNISTATQAFAPRVSIRKRHPKDDPYASKNTHKGTDSWMLMRLRTSVQTRSHWSLLTKFSEDYCYLSMPWSIVPANNLMAEKYRRILNLPKGQRCSIVAMQYLTPMAI